MLNDGAVKWTSKRQKVVALSTKEAEYVAFSRAKKNVVHFRQLTQDLHQQQRGATTIHEDNERAIKLTNKPMASNMTKHIDIKHRYIRETVGVWTVVVVSVGAADMLVDGLTRALQESKHTMILRRCMGGAKLRIVIFLYLPMV
jgi:predicted ribosome-associated RNA-binding protein Tma20